MTPPPLRLAVVSDYDVVVAGVQAMLQRYARRVMVVDLDLAGDSPHRVDVALYDTFGQPQGDSQAVARLVRDPHVGALAVYTWNFQPELVAGATDHGVRGYLSKTLSAAALTEALERVRAGESVVSPPAGNAQVAGEWPGREEGLSPREAEVVALIAQGLPNTAIAAQTHVSINSVKSYIRTAYRKMDVASRSQAVLWAVQHGFEPTPRRARLVVADGPEPPRLRRVDGHESGARSSERTGRPRRDGVSRSGGSTRQ